MACVDIPFSHWMTLILYSIDNWLICWWIIPLSTLFQLYHGVSWISYQYYWSNYPDTSQSVVMLTPQPWVPRRAAISTTFTVFGMTRPGIEPATSRTRGRGALPVYHRYSTDDRLHSVMIEHISLLEVLICRSLARYRIYRHSVSSLNNLYTIQYR